MLPTFESFYNNILKALKESVDLDSLPTFKDPTTIHDHITVENGEKVIKGNIYFTNQVLTELPDLSDVKVLGSFLCYNNQLQTLEGAPKYVGGYFSCNSNPQLTNLKGAPEYVGGSFDCGYNYLQTLEGLPRFIGGNLCWCSTKVTMEDFYENLLLSNVKGNPMASYKNEGESEYPEPPMSREEAYATAKAYKLYNTPLDYTIDF